MSSKTNNPGRDNAKAAADKAARLAEALRANLHRRKQQARARAGEQARRDDTADHEDKA